MLTKLKLALALSATLVAGTVGFAAANNGGANFDKGKMLQKYDANGDGKLDDTERAKMKADFQAKRAEHKAKMLAKYDTNKDGKLDQGERVAMREAKADERFAKLDKNGDGVISREEFKAGAAERGGRHGGHRGGHGRGGHGGQGQGQSGQGQAGDTE